MHSKFETENNFKPINLSYKITIILFMMCIYQCIEIIVN